MVPLIVVAVAAFTGGLIWLIFSLLRHSDVCQMAVQRAGQSPAAVSIVGQPIQPGFFVMGTIKIRNGVGRASLSIPVRGSKGEATLETKAAKSSGVWTLTELRLIPASGERPLDLLAGGAAR